METSYLKQHFGLRIYDIVDHILTKLNAVVREGDTRVVNIKIKDGEDTYLAMRLVFDVEDESYLKEAKVYGDHAEGLLENGRNKFLIRLFSYTQPFHRFATGIGSKVDFNPIFDALMVGNGDKEFTLHSDKNDSALNGVAMISTMFIVKDYESSEGLSYVIKTVDEADFSGNSDVDIVFDAALAVNVSDAEEGEDNVLFTKAIVNKWRNNHYSWMLYNAAEKVYNSWKFTRFKCNIALSVDDMPDLKRLKFIRDVKHQDDHLYGWDWYYILEDGKYRKVKGYILTDRVPTGNGSVCPNQGARVTLKDPDGVDTTLFMDSYRLSKGMVTTDVISSVGGIYRLNDNFYVQIIV
nr:MAG TPA: hypothetical protein [Caudoviricetes sp.]